jgi:hypothetical protein
MRIVICSSASFYKKVVEIAAELEKLGYEVAVPSAVRHMQESGDFDVNHYKTWFQNKDDYYKKTSLIREHFKEITAGDVVLVLNYEKHGVKNYIGGNVLVEMAVAFYLNKPIYVLNELPEESSFLEEIISLGSISLHGKLQNLPKPTKL